MSQIEELVCIVCPRGCNLKIDKDTMEVTGNLCPRGVRYAKEELSNPKRTLCTTVKCKSKNLPRCPVKTSEEVPKDKIFDLMKLLRRVEIIPPVKAGDVVVENALETGADIVSTRTIEA